MSVFVPNSFQNKFKNNVEMVLQQQKSKLEDAVVWQDDASADLIKVKDLIGNNAPQEADERHGDTKWNNRTFDGVYIGKPNELYDAELIDNADTLATSIDIKGAGTMGAAGTVNRAKDQRVLQGFYGPIISGKPQSLVTTPFPGGLVIPVTTGGASGAQKMNVAKLIAANKQVEQQYVDTDLEKYMVATADDNASLLAEIPATSSDFKGAYGGEFKDGKVLRLLGWNFIHLELDNPMLGPVPTLATDGSGYRKTPFWVRGGVVGNYWQRLRTRVGELPEKLWSLGTLAGTTVAASRTQPGMSGIILNQKG